MELCLCYVYASLYSKVHSPPYCCALLLETVLIDLYLLPSYLIKTLRNEQENYQEQIEELNSELEMKEQLHQQQLRHQQQQKTLNEAELFQRERPAGQSTIMDDDDDDDKGIASYFYAS